VGLLVCDFDDTITEKDTIGALMAAAVEANVKVSNRQPLNLTVHNTTPAHTQH
jgi:2-hydroxy-3-keto-5-methylthiopentenyl-1-phosphate phosphatase